MKSWLLLDMNFLAHRARHSTGSLQFQGEGTGVAFGVLRAVDDMMQMHKSDIIVLAFDYPALGHRKKILPQYKSSRRENLTQQEIDDYKVFQRQLQRLKTELLPQVGYRNIVEVEGFEADDIIAQYARDLPDGDKAVIISADADLFQCLRDGVELYNPTSKKWMTASLFKDQWGIDTHQWPHVKCLAGCKTDDVPGIPGIGEKSAAGFFSGKLKETNKKYEKIFSNLHLIKQNLPLVRLPFPGLVLPNVNPDAVNEMNKIKVNEILGIRSERQTDRARQAAKKKQAKIEGFDL